jgi:hypothetical protein
MYSYGRDNKLKYNYIDYHPRRQYGYINWWEDELKKVVKKRERQEAKKYIYSELKINKNYV